MHHDSIPSPSNDDPRSLMAIIRQITGDATLSAALVRLADLLRHNAYALSAGRYDEAILVSTADRVTDGAKDLYRIQTRLQELCDVVDASLEDEDVIRAVMTDTEDSGKTPPLP